MCVQLHQIAHGGEANGLIVPLQVPAFDHWCCGPVDYLKLKGGVGLGGREFQVFAGRAVDRVRAQVWRAAGDGRALRYFSGGSVHYHRVHKLGILCSLTWQVLISGQQDAPDLILPLF